ncbi:MAG: type I-MYXAN CRISPR-associated protein Cas6/Cmx6 [Pyrinomonadaceae bacterium]
MKNDNETEFFRNISVHFPIQGKNLPADHGYLLYSAISQIKPELHETGWLGVEMVSGLPSDNGIITLPRNAELRLRIPAEKFGEVIPLAGKLLEIDGYKIRLGIPMARPLIPAANLYARIVTIRGFMEAPEFLEAANRQLAEMNITAKLEFPPEERSRFRRILTVKDKKIVGFSLLAKNLSDEDSIKLQSHGIGGRRAMGCGIFNPVLKNIDSKKEEL